MHFELEAPTRRRKKWRVVGYLDGRLSGDQWVCDSEWIAKEVLRRLRAGEKPGWVASYLRGLE